MRLGSLSGRAVLVTDTGSIDIAHASGGVFGPDPQPLYQRWAELEDWARTLDNAEPCPFDVTDLGPPVPAPPQVFAVGLNYREHATESELDVPSEFPPVFTKFRTSIAPPVCDVVLPAGNVDWEVELVVVMARRAERVSRSDAWSHVAGLTVGQDVSERMLQLSGPVPQFSLGKSHPGFAPMGPYVVSLDEFANPDNVELGASINGEQMQKARTSDLLFSVPDLIAGLSAVLPLLPGDVIFTGTPSGVGMGRSPQRFLTPGDELVSYVEGIGELRQRFLRNLSAARRR